MAKPTSKVVLYADDLTGACDAGVAFCARGLSTRVLLPGMAERNPAADVDVRVYTLDSRNLPPPAAAAAQRAACSAELRSPSSAVVFKKVDSTIRGNVGPEIAALMESHGFDLCIFAPAMPKSRRTTVGGFQLLDGVPVDRTAMGQDPGSAVGNAYLPSLFAGQPGLAVTLVTLGTDPAAAIHEAAAAAAAGSQRTVLVLDAVSDDDLAVIAAASAKVLALAAAAGGKGMPLLAGSAGLSFAMSEALFKSRGDVIAPVRASITANPRPDGPVVVVVGTRQPVTKEQVKVLRNAADLEVVDVGLTSSVAGGGADRVLLADATDLSTASDIIARACDLASTTGSGIVATGGSTCTEILAQLGAVGLDILEEVEHNVPISMIRGGRCDGMPLVCKGGALGTPNAIVESAHAVQDVAKAISAGTAGSATKPLIAITVGDVCGVGPEIILKALAQKSVQRLANYVCLGIPERMELATSFVKGCKISIRRVHSVADCRFDPNVLEVFCPFEYDLSKIQTGVECPEAGRCAAKFVIEGCKLALEGTVDAISTAPLNKAAMHKGGYVYGGHTELIQECCGAKSSTLCLTSDALTVVHATCHVPFKDISERLADPGRILETIRLVHGFCRMRWPHRQPRIAVAGLNPHCEPIFGDEETRLIQPAIDEANKNGWTVSPKPIPPDTVFLRAANGEFDTVVAMYHDQGHIPSKIAGFSSTVNVTLGLPMIRTSVDHGTAFDIAGTGIADDMNMIKALELAAFMIKGRRAKADQTGTAAVAPLVAKL